MLEVVELFAGVGGFKIGLEKTKKFKVIWSNQWEPLTKTQHASMVYENIWGKEGHSNQNIEEVKTDEIPDCDVLVGGFPCQDYSVATTLKNSKGLKGKKGVLWWSINRILVEKKKKPSYLILENVDRLLKSPSSQRGRDFAIMLACLDRLGYAVEWRIINAADYGFPQRRRRVFIIGYLKGTKQYNQIDKDAISWMDIKGTLAKGFKVKDIEDEKIKSFNLIEGLSDISEKEIEKISEYFGKSLKTSPFENCGVFINGKVRTVKTYPDYSGEYKKLKDIIEKGKVDDSFYIDKNDIAKWNYLKGAKKEKRITKDGFEYNYSEGGMIFPDNLENASRTIITGEGGSSPSRFKHVINTKYGLRRLTPVELEKLNGFPVNHTKLEGITDTKRAFFMGNALVCGVVEIIGDFLE